MIILLVYPASAELISSRPRRWMKNGLRPTLIDDLIEQVALSTPSGSRSGPSGADQVAGGRVEVAALPAG